MITERLSTPFSGFPSCGGTFRVNCDDELSTPFSGFGSRAEKT